jgi:hypothetical protein
MKRLLPVALLLLGTLAHAAPAATGNPPATGSESAALQKEARAEIARLEALRRPLPPWQVSAATTSETLRKLTTTARNLAMAAMADQERWQQAQKDWNGPAADKALAEHEGKFQPLPADPGNAPLSAALSHLKDKLAGTRTAMAHFERAGLTGKPSERGLLLDQSQALLDGLSAASQAAEGLRAQVDGRITELDNRLLLLRTHASSLHQPSLPAPPAATQEKKP